MFIIAFKVWNHIKCDGSMGIDDADGHKCTKLCEQCGGCNKIVLRSVDSMLFVIVFSFHM